MRNPLHVYVYEKGLKTGPLKPAELRGQELDGLMISQHDGAANEQLVKALSGARNSVRNAGMEFMEIERDKGVNEILENVARTVATQGGRTRMAVAQVVCNRVVVDSNRRREIVDGTDGERRFAGAMDFYKSYDDYRYELDAGGLVAAYKAIRRDALGLVEAVRCGGFVLDMHTMWPYSLDKNIFLAGRNSIPVRVTAHTSPSNWSAERDGIAFIGDPEINDGIGDAEFMNNMIDALDGADCPTSSVGAYGASDLVGTLTEEIFKLSTARGSRALVLDLPKHMVFGCGPVEYATLEYGKKAPPPFNRVQTIGGAIAEAISRTIKQ